MLVHRLRRWPSVKPILSEQQCMLDFRPSYLVQPNLHPRNTPVTPTCVRRPLCAPDLDIFVKSEALALVTRGCQACGRESVMMTWILISSRERCQPDKVHMVTLGSDDKCVGCICDWPRDFCSVYAQQYSNDSRGLCAAACRTQLDG